MFDWLGRLRRDQTAFSAFSVNTQCQNLSVGATQFHLMCKWTSVWRVWCNCSLMFPTVGSPRGRWPRRRRNRLSLFSMGFFLWLPLWVISSHLRLRVKSCLFKAVNHKSWVFDCLWLQLSQFSQMLLDKWFKGGSLFFCCCSRDNTNWH